MSRRHLGLLPLVLCVLGWQPLAACTIGAFGPEATVDGRPILWKNRDVVDQNQEARFFTGKRFRYVTNVYAVDTSESAPGWGGINEAGFAIMNSNSNNLLPDADDPDDGNVMSLALGTCASVAEFDVLMESLNIVGRNTCANFGVFDSTGVTAMYEAGNTRDTALFTIYDSLDMQVRSNFSLTGDSMVRRDLWGRGRYLRAVQVTVAARHENRISPRYVIQELARDLGQVHFDPYPLPYEDTFGDLPFGYLPVDSTLCRKTTRSVEVMVGPKPGEPAARGMMWILLGAPEVALPIPVWVQGGPVPAPLNGPERSEICDRAIALRGYVRDNSQYPEAINTFHMLYALSSFAETESTLFDMVAAAESLWPQGIPPEEANAITERACNLVLDAYDGFWVRPSRARVGSVSDTLSPAQATIVGGAIRLGLPVSGRSGVARVFDASGRQVARLPVLSGQAVLKWEPVGLRSGRYFVVFPAGTQSRPARFTYIR